MSNKYHIAATGKNAGQYVPCDAKVNCRIGGEHLSKAQAEIKNLILSSDALLGTVPPVGDSSDDISEETTFDPAILETYYKAYLEHGGRSAKKLEPVHGFIAQSLADNLPEDFVVTSKGYGTNKEKKVSGLLYNKDSDVTVSDKDGNDLGVIAVKLPAGNFKQNANNYFENMLGETANLKLAGVKVSHAIFLPHKIPYYNSDGILERIETINDSDIDKYRKLMSQKSIVKPNSLFITIVEYGMEDSFRVGMHKDDVRTSKSPAVFDYSRLANGNFSKENAKFITKHSNYQKFIKKLANKLSS